MNIIYITILVILILSVFLLYWSMNNAMIYRMYFVAIGRGVRIKERIYGDDFDVIINGKTLKIFKIDNIWNVRDENGQEQLLKIGEVYYYDNVQYGIKDNSAMRSVVIKLYPMLTTIFVLIPVAFTMFISIVPSYSEVQNDNTFAENESISDNSYQSLGGDKDEKQNIYKTGNEESEDITTETITVFKVENMSAYNGADNNDFTQLKKIDKDTVFTVKDHNENVKYDAYRLVQKRICMWYGEGGATEYIFIGQYDDDYNWDGECLVCAYRENKLLYTTIDNYNNGKLESYRRISRNNNRWVYTDRTVIDKHNTDGDNISYKYRDINKKSINRDELKEEDAYTPNDVRKLLKDDIIHHYHGLAVDTVLKDDTGNAYMIKYEAGEISEIYSGTFVTDSIHYGTGWLIRHTVDNKYSYIKGVFHDKNGETVENGTNEKIINQQEFEELVSGMPFEEEIADWINI